MHCCCCAGRRRFLLYAGANQQEMGDVKNSIEDAFKAQKYKKGGKFVVHTVTGNTVLSLDKLLEYDAVHTWSGSVQYHAQFSDTLAKYYEVPPNSRNRHTHTHTHT